jgi:hypothetical protein
LTHLPWEYFWIGFNKINFPDLFDPLWIGAGLMLIVLVVLYVMRTRALHRHRHYLDMWEWIFWSGIISWFLVVVGAIFQFDFAVVLVILFSGLGTMAYARFRKFPPCSRRMSTSSPASGTSAAPGARGRRRRSEPRAFAGAARSADRARPRTDRSR